MMKMLKTREELADDYTDFYDDEEFCRFCQELARLILCEDDPVRRSNKVAVLDEVVHSVDELRPVSALELSKEEGV